ncbi:hypothetical protein niasHT_017815 [Heterodera trifolii]|uniref:Uncharacterized protein n=1 Tax=Heterodera trifolii TaxID=157864 RepID=A0ABD2KUY2_9BILA
MRLRRIATARLTSASQSPELNSPAFQSPELNSPAFQLLGLKLSNPSAFQSLGLHFCVPIAGTQFSGIPIAGTQFFGIPITWTQTQQSSGIPITGFQLYAIPMTGTQDSTLRHSNLLTRPLRGLVQGPSAPLKIFCAKGTHSAASRPRTRTFGPLSNFLRQRTHSAASQPRSGAFGPLSNFLRQRYSLGRFAASGELASAVSVLQLFPSSPKPTLRFAAVRTLNRISMDYPQAVISCNVDLEQLISFHRHVGHHHSVENGCRGER